MALDLCHLVITEMQCVEHHRVELREHRQVPRHVVGRSVSRTHIMASRSSSSSRWVYTFSSFNLISTLEEITSTADPGIKCVYGRIEVVVTRRSNPSSSSCMTCICSFLGFEWPLPAPRPLVPPLEWFSVLHFFLHASHSSVRYNFPSCYNNVSVSSNASSASFNCPVRSAVDIVDTLSNVLIAIVVCLKRGFSDQIIFMTILPSFNSSSSVARCTTMLLKRIV
jgi:hypothetical protein